MRWGHGGERCPVALTIKEIEAAKPREKAYKLSDEHSLYLEVRPNGSRLWMWKYRIEGKEKRISFGPFPEVSLKEARRKCEDARRLHRERVDPSALRKAQRKATATVGDTFETVAREWYERWKVTKAANHHLRVLRALERDVFPKIGRLPIASLEPVGVLPVLRAIEERGAQETAHRVKQVIGMIFRYGVATGKCPRDPTADLRGALGAVQPRHHPAITDPVEFGELLRAVDAYAGLPITACALRLLPLLFVRPGELRHAEWAELDFDAATWVIPASKMKLRRDHVVPLATQAVALFKQAHELTGKGRYVFPSLRSRERAMSENTLNAALRRLGYSTDEMTCHGFRASFRTIGAEVLDFRVELMEHQLAHAVRDPLGRAYNRAQFLPERRAMMQRWADWCDEAKAEKETVNKPKPSAPRSSAAARRPRSESPGPSGSP